MPTAFTYSYQQEVQYCGIFQQGQEHKEHACNHPQRDGSHPLNIGADIGDCIEDVSQHKEQCYKQSHPSRNNLRWNHKTDP